jgi:hypothetical protein
MTHPCPSCERLLTQSGEVSIHGKTLPVFQCDYCIKTVELLGAQVEVNLTFAVDGSAIIDAGDDLD